jgi:hypothetical protein
MNSISRKEQSQYLDEGFLKQAFTGFERISFGTSKIDPFEKYAVDDIWKIVGKKLLRNKKRGIK